MKKKKTVYTLSIHEVFDVSVGDDMKAKIISLSNF